jgi:hypothetical protein
MRTLAAMTTTNSGRWVTPLVGVLALLMALGAVFDLLFVPVAESEQVFFGYMLTGRAAQSTTLIHIAFFVWVAWLSFRRRALTVWVVIAYLVYLIPSLWIWTSLYGTNFEASSTTAVLVNALASVVLLVLCRMLYGQRHAFDQ